MPDRREFLRLLALSTAGMACTTNTPRVDAGSPTPTGTAAPPTPSPTASTPARASALRWRRLELDGGPPVRREHTFTHTVDGSYVFGGRAGGDPLGDLWRFDGERWRKIDAGGGPSPRFGHNAVHIDGWLMVFGGQAGGDLFNDAYAFQIDEQRWMRLDTSGGPPGIRYGAGAIASGNRMLVSHGFNFQGRFDDTWSLDRGSTRWRNRSPDGLRPVRRCLHRCAPQGDAMVLVGGQTDGRPYLGDTWSYDVAQRRWRELDGRGPRARNLFALVGDGERVWLFGGFSDAGPLDDTWVLDPGGRWRRRQPDGPTPGARGGIEGAFVPGSPNRMLVFGGDDGDGELNDLWELELPA